MKPTMQIMFAVALATLFVAVSCSSVHRHGAQVGAVDCPQHQKLQLDSDEESDEFQERDLGSWFVSAANLAKQAFTDFGKAALGVIGEGLETGSDKLSQTSIGKNKVAAGILSKTSALGARLIALGGKKEIIDEIISLIKHVISGKYTIKEALIQVGIDVLDKELTPTKMKLTIAGKSLEVIGGVVETVAVRMNDAANSTAEELVDEILTKLGGEDILKTTISVIDKELNIKLEDMIAAKLAEIDNSDASMKEKVLAVSNVVEIIGETLETIGETAEDLGDSSVVDYPAIIEKAINELKAYLAPTPDASTDASTEASTDASTDATASA